MEKDSDSTLTSLDENTENLCDNPTRDTLAEGIVSLFQPIIDQLDDRVRSTRLAQQELSEQLDSLIAQLRSIEDIQQTSPEFDTYVHKLINVKHKVTVIYSILQGAQDRLNRIHKQVEREKLKRRSILDSELNSPNTPTTPTL
ncbi:SNAPIN protein homolog [Sitodiplosis mosellana]|uniref:SNAPIN protein homolog n=1 Tax=Sitodiplosis mosellana TaxID=263140 RepID=UPI0024450929|nr:SNAPIN protein homolog [Sitodiplosis mosellana]